MKNPGLCIFGEVLFDHFPDGQRVLGGAPFNVAWHLHAFGQRPLFISRVGDDPEGDSVRTAMRDWGMTTTGLQTDPERPTGRVSVSFRDGEPAYDIVAPCAYDAIAAEPLPAACRLLYHGSLALREDASYAAAQQLAASGPDIVFVDVNLRPPWWQPSRVLQTLEAAHWVKLNRDELAQLHPGATGDAASAAEFVAAHRLKGLVLTRGSDGAEILTDTGERHAVRPERDIEVVDTVGAGDSFTSVVILGLVNNWPLDQTLQRAQTFASRVVGRRGATVDDTAFYRPFVDAWQLSD